MPSRFLLLAAVVGVFLGTEALLLPSMAEAQIWVVTEADGSERFTTVPEPGARVYMATRHDRRVESLPRPGIGGPAAYDAEIFAAATESGLSPALVRAVIASESAFDPRAISPKGARGLMQLMPDTARQLGVRDVWDPEENIRGGTAYLSRLIRRYENLELALAAYNAGPGAVDRHGGVPPFAETRKYVQRVLERFQRYQGTDSGRP